MGDGDHSSRNGWIETMTVLTSNVCFPKSGASKSITTVVRLLRAYALAMTPKMYVIARSKTTKQSHVQCSGDCFLRFKPGVATTS
jgi:hypothetical protein